MKSINLIVVALMGLSLSAQATLFYEGTPGNGISTVGIIGQTLANQTIADGNPAGTWNQMSVGDFSGGISSVAVTVNVSGGYNGDLYAYLVAPDGRMVVLLNRIGVSSGTPFGDAGSALNVTLSDAATSGNIQAATSLGSGTYQASGLNISPLSAVGSFASGVADALSGFNGTDSPNGVWTLFFADVVAGGGAETLNGWSLSIVPEPVTVALIIFPVLLVGLAGLRRLRRA